MNRIALCFEIEEVEDAEVLATLARADDWPALYREFRDAIYPRFKSGPRVCYGADFRKWIALGMMYPEDGDRTFRPIYGLTDRAYDVRGYREFEAAVKSYRAQQEQIRAQLKVF